MGRIMSYLFVDGGYLTARLKEWSEGFADGDLIDLDFKEYLGGREKVFYYDALPSRKSNESAEQFEARLAAVEAHHAKLRSVPGCHVFNGKTIEGGRRLQQKGVDVLLATHMLTHVFRKNAKHVSLLAGDADFAPLVRALVMEGAYVMVIYARSSYSSDLLGAADVSVPIRVQDILQKTTPVFRRKHEPANIFNAHHLSDQHKKLVRTGRTTTGEEVRLFEGGGEYLLATRNPNSPSQFIHITYRNLELLERFADDQEICVAWDKE
jgi:uncharacterized LabA/DUF88 family protein